MKLHSKQGASNTIGEHPEYLQSPSLSSVGDSKHPNNTPSESPKARSSLGWARRDAIPTKGAGSSPLVSSKHHGEASPLPSHPRRVAPLSPPREENQACLDASLLMLRAAMDNNSKAYEYLFRSSSNLECGNQEVETATDDNKHWLSIVQQIQQIRAKETSKLKQDLQNAKAKSKHYKAELRENLSERLQFLEDRVLAQQRQQRQQAEQNQYILEGCGGGESVTATTQSSVTDNGSATVDDASAYHHGKGRGSEQHLEQAQLLERLEQTQKEFSQERRDWLRRLDVVEGRYSADLEEWQREIAQLKDDSRRLLAERDQLLNEKKLHEGGVSNSSDSTSTTGSRLKNRLDQTKRERDEALSLLEQLQEKYSSLQEDLEASQAKVKEAKKFYQEELKALDEPIADVEAVYRESLEQRKDLQARLRHVEAQHANDKATWKLQLECALASARNAATEHEQVQGQLTEVLELHMKEKEEWRKERDADLNKIKKQHEAERDESIQAATAEQEQQHETHLSEWQEQLREMEGQLSSAELQLNLAKSELNQARGQLAESEHQASKLEEQKQAALADVTRISDKLVETEDSQSKDLQDMADQVAKLKQDLHEAQLDAIRISDKLIQSQNKHTKEIAALKDKHQRELSKQTSSLSEEDIAALQERVEEFETALDASRRTNAAFNEENEQWKETAEQLERNLNRVMESEAQSLESHQQHVELLQGQNTALTKQVEALEVELASTKHIVENADFDKESWSQVEAELKLLREENGDLRAQKDELEQDISSSDRELKEREGQLKSLHAVEVQELEQRLKETLAEKEQEWSRMLQESCAQTNDLQLRCSRAEGLSAEQATDLNVELEGYKLKIEELERSCEQVDVHMSQQEGEWNLKLRAYQAQVKDLARQYADADAVARRNAQALLDTKAGNAKEIAELRRKLGDCEADYRNLEQQGTEDVRDLEMKHAKTVLDLEEEHTKCNQELEEKHAQTLRDLEETHLKEMKELEVKRTQDLHDLKQRHDRDVLVLIEDLKAANAESQVLSDQSNILANSLEEVNALHENKTSHWQAEIVRLEQENAKLRDEVLTVREDTLGVQERIAVGLEKHHKEVSCAVEELREDIASVREACVGSDEDNRLAANKSSAPELVLTVNKIHTNIHDTLAEITLETENLIECRNGIQTLVDRTSKLAGPDEDLKNQMKSLEEMLSEVLDRGLTSNRNEPSTALTSCMADLSAIKDLLVQERHLKEDAKELLTCKLEQLGLKTQDREKTEQHVISLEDQTEQLAFERKMRAKAEQEIVMLNDQADAYGEELMRVQAVNRNLEDTLREAEHRMDAALGTTETAEVVAVGADETAAPAARPDVDASDTSPIIEETLALAQNLTALIQDQNDAERETSVMEMLETISEMIDKTDSTLPTKRPPVHHISIPVKVDISSPTCRRCNDDNDDDDMGPDENPPLPISSPPLTEKDIPTGKTGELTVVVDKLYNRCQMLERERTEIMEVTLDVLQSAREASSAELEAALATARRKAAEEMLKVREENQRNVWQLYHRLCGSCQNGLVGSEGNCGSCQHSLVTLEGNGSSK